MKQMKSIYNKRKVKSKEKKNRVLIIGQLMDSEMHKTNKIDLQSKDGKIWKTNKIEL